MAGGKAACHLLQQEERKKPMETIKLYYQDAFMQEFDAVVLDCTAEKKGFLVTLDRTAFYPEGGGQPADHGTLGGVQVLDVHEKDGVILHTCNKPLTPGEKVHGVLDWQRRFDNMQQHSGEHIVSGMLCSTFHCDNVGFHMGTDTVIIDYNAEISWEQVLEIEARANQYIWENHSFTAFYPSPEELKELPYRSKKELTGPVRITTFPGADLCACCGTHVKESGQVGLVKFLSCQKFRDGVRLELLCGKRAFDYLAMNWEQNSAVGRSLSVKPEGPTAAVSRVLGEIQQLKERCKALEEAHFSAMAEQLAGQGDVLLVQEEMSSDSLRRLCDAVSQTCGGRCAAFAGSGTRYQYAIIAPGQDIRDLVKALNSTLSGRGGGRDSFAQGSVQAGEADIRAFFAGV